MAELTTPFDYRNILIGEEIIYRALVQQEDHAGQGKYGAEWTERDAIDKSAAYFTSNVLRADFTIPSEYGHCIPEPPCPWDKQEHKVELSKIKPIVTAADGVYTYVLAIHQRADTASAYTIGNKVVNFISDQNALSAGIRGEFNYFSVQALSQYLGAAIFGGS
jgi:hypothetical protein